ncbi:MULTISPECIES: 30S ribosome-binding factor RbfA [Bifidobacterium]|jgi:ribosome-binding factor A|uniref:Ribosome-binding factor A n=1 Tax=Bifidobacterium tibiigranuli TaxID=2172043 RepID=A0A5N6S012_9BIFI|nr:30S ribosome-binding factor RbfA [Bifidobacterium tibiigranuli]KAE8127505.1 30S ribosome-binding factor RbfA [Bifidobacterium tibiigranuli]KAE8127952.1 30S ribosome-binding factor RbfA [Bifidobacterium tibiigranuli]MCH3975106.1 30S ribosome-binding factor RbfA [Bifidobacterium tibiigranuli]MCH4190467.1 30S ribosome-binding factor RbfA [Bifidobacterium tibiigranuli]MCH4202864.1 30S ribosome-binding factor RbfA [Bifidobacterium tibiigranuli]
MAGTNPRAARIAKLIQRVIAASIETQLHDKRLENVTITEVRVTNDLQLARVFWTQLGDEGKEQGERKRATQALRQAKGRLRAAVGAKAGLRLTPELQFMYDEVPSEAHEIEDILATAHKRDEELAKARANAQYAGEEDPYWHNDEPEDGESDDGFDESDDAEDADGFDGFNDADSEADGALIDDTVADGPADGSAVDNDADSDAPDLHSAHEA